MDKIIFKVRASPATFLKNENEDYISPLVNIVLIVSIFSYRALSHHGGLKPNFIYYEKKVIKKPPLQKRRKEE